MPSLCSQAGRASSHTLSASASTCTRQLLRPNYYQPRPAVTVARAAEKLNRYLHQPATVYHPQRRARTSIATQRPVPASLSLPNRRLISAPPRQDGGDHQPVKITRSIGLEWYDLSPQAKLRLLLNGEDGKWGWVIYRCTYKPELEGRWQSFKRAVVEHERTAIVKSDAPEILGKMDWVFVEGPALEGASREDLKPRFREWASNEAGSNLDHGRSDRGSRYSYFIQIDEEALRSIPGDGDNPSGTPTWRDIRQNGHVKVVQAWQDFPDSDIPKHQNPDNADEDKRDWIKMRPSMLTASFYLEFDNDENWHLQYYPPPGIRRYQ